MFSWRIKKKIINTYLLNINSFSMRKVPNLELCFNSIKVMCHLTNSDTNCDKY